MFQFICPGVFQCSKLETKSAFAIRERVIMSHPYQGIQGGYFRWSIERKCLFPEAAKPFCS